MWHLLRVAHSQEQAPGVAEEEVLPLAEAEDFPVAVPAAEADKFHLSEFQKKITFATKIESYEAQRYFFISLYYTHKTGLRTKQKLYTRHHSAKGLPHLLRGSAGNRYSGYG